MKIKILIGSIALLFSIAINAQVSDKNKVRIVENFNKNWKFQLGDSAIYNETEFNDSKWRKLELPHDWSIEHEFSEKNSGRNAWLPGGIAWYRKMFSVEKEHENKHIEIQFDGIYRHSEIWVNGQYVGAQYDGYTSFYFDISPYIQFGKPNIIAIRVDNSVQPNCRWYSGSGIYRNSWLTITNPIHVKNWGTYITTPVVSKDEAQVKIQTTIENFSGKTNAIVETIIKNADGIVVGSVSSTLKADLISNYNIDQHVTIKSPKLWNLESPNLYTAISKIIIDGVVVDDYVSSFGIRTLNFDADNGFFLNGENVKMKGVCLHSDGGAVGAAVPIEIWKRRLESLKAIGCNAIRTSHNVQAPEFMDLCDSLGFLVMDEFVDKWDDPIFGDPYFEKEWQQNFQKSIERDRNHPSVVIWSVGNENHSPEDPRQQLGLKKYTSFVRSIDSTRPVVSGMERGKDTKVIDKINNIIETCNYMDLIALNYGEQWCTEIGNRNPGKPYVSTESYTYFNSEPEKRFANIEKSPWLDVMENDHNMGLFLWVGIDYLGESKTFQKLGSDSGLLDLAGFRKPISYLYEAFWSDKPMVYVGVYDGDANDFSTSGRWGSPSMKETWNIENRKEVDLVTYTNCQSVNLYLNGKLIGNKKLSDFTNWIVKWQKVEFKTGIIKAAGVIDGKEVCEFELKTAGNPHHIKIIPEAITISKDGVTQIEVSVVDRKGTITNQKVSELSFKAEGAAKIIALSNGDIKDTTINSNLDFRKTNNGKCLVIVKGTGIAGPIKVIVKSKGLPDSVLNLKSF